MTVLLVLIPMSYIFFSITEYICTLSFTFSFYILTFVCISILKNCFAFSIWTTSFQLSSIFCSIFKFVISQ